MKISIVPYHEMRYASCGDYIMENGRWHFYIVKLSKRRYEWLILWHEIIECYLCWWLGIDEKDITAFDIEYESHRELGDNSEPGNSPLAPYFFQHQIATFFERI